MAAPTWSPTASRSRRCGRWTRSGAGTGPGNLIAPYQHFTQPTQRKLVAGEQVTVDVELYGTVTRIPKGHRLRLVVASTSHHLSPGAAQLVDLAGGVYEISHSSRLSLMTAPPASLPARCTICRR